MNIKTKLKSLLAGAMALGGLFASAAPTVEITEVGQPTPGSGKVDCSYTVGGLEGKAYDLVIKVEAEDAEKGAVSTNLVFEFVAEGAATQTIDCRALFGKAYPNVAFYAMLEKSEVQLWEGGPYWAKCNVGAKKPEEAGFYFWWGDTEGYVRNATDDGWVSAKDGTTTIQFSETDATASQTLKSKATLISEGWIDESGNLTMEHDAARQNLGGDWRMPTRAELNDLVSQTTTKWTTRNGVKGLLATSKTNGKSIFFPAASYSHGSDIIDRNEHGGGFSSTLDSNKTRDAWSLEFNSWRGFYMAGTMHCTGYTVRPVRSAK